MSDTHGLLRPEVASALKGCSMILHAGDVGEGVLDKLQRISTTVAVRGNTDRWPWGAKLHLTERVQIHNWTFHVVHDLASFPTVPQDTQVVVHGHSHRWSCIEENGIWYVNPGSAGPRRFNLPITLGIAVIEGSQIRFERIDIEA
ncbi:MAG: metallophosphoesterase family protein [Limnochordia bacterium]